ncbi:prephenate dehydrogenase [Pseudomonadota bacterium]
MIRQLTIIGVGLIGGSLARALKEAGYCHEVVGCGRDATHLQKAVDLGVIDRFSTEVAEAVAGADMIVVAVPLGAMESCFSSMIGHLAEDAVITDAGSAKASVVEAAERAFKTLPAGFVPGHPIAGTERSGVEASFAELYQGRRVIVTPVEQSSSEAVSKVIAMWEKAGATVDTMAVTHHDEVLAATSHLPHLLAFGLVDTLINMDESEEIFRFAAGGFRDFTRIASSNPPMWRDIFLANREAMLAVLDRYQKDLEQLKASIEDSDGDAMEAVFSRAKSARDRFAKQLEN